MGCKKFFHCINLNILISQVYEFCERWYMRHRWPWCINSEKKDLIAALARWLFWGLRVCFFATFPFCAKLNLPTCGQASEVVYNMQVHFEAKHLLWEEIHVAGLCAPVPLRACTRAQCTVQCAGSACALDFWSPASRECGWKSWTATGTRGQCVGQTCFFPSHPPGSFVPGWAFTVSNHNYVFNRLDATEC